MPDETEGEILAVFKNVSPKAKPLRVHGEVLDDVRLVELTLRIVTPGEFDRNGNERNNQRRLPTHEDVLEVLAGYFNPSRMPAWLNRVEVDAVYDEEDDE